MIYLLDHKNTLENNNFFLIDTRNRILAFGQLTWVNQTESFVCLSCTRISSWLIFPKIHLHSLLRFATELRLQEMKDFFASRPEAGAGAASRKIALEAVENNIKFIRNYSNDIQSWLSANVRPWFFSSKFWFKSNNRNLWHRFSFNTLFKYIFDVKLVLWFFSSFWCFRDFNA